MLAIRSLLTLLVVLTIPAVSVAQQAKKPKPIPAFKWVNPLPKDVPQELRQGTFQSAANQSKIGYCILLPPGYSEDVNMAKRYPVVYWLHGGRPGSETKNVSMAKYFVAAMREDKIPPMIYVFPNGGKLSHYDHGEHKGEQAFLELVKHVDTTYRTIADRSGRAVEGFSQGGRGTGRYLFKFPELFCSAAPLGGGQQHEKRISESAGKESDSLTIEPATNNTWDLAKQYAANQDAPKLRIFVAVGDQDFNYEANKEWSQFLKSLDVEHTFVIVPGIPHSSQKMYDQIGDQILQFHVESFHKSGAIAKQ